MTQGYILSMLIFNIYPENINKDALADQEEGTKVNDVAVNKLRYADDTLAETQMKCKYF